MSSAQERRIHMKKIIVMLLTFCPIFSFGQTSTVGKSLIEAGTTSVLQNTGKTILPSVIGDNVAKSLGQAALNGTIGVGTQMMIPTLQPINPGMLNVKAITPTAPVVNAATNMPSIMINHSVLGVQPVVNTSSHISTTGSGKKPSNRIFTDAMAKKLQRAIITRYHSVAGHYDEADIIFKVFSSNPQEALNDLNNDVIWGKNTNKLRREQLEKVRPEYINIMQSNAVPTNEQEWLAGVEAMSALIGIGDETSINAVLSFVEVMPLKYRKATDVLATRLLTYKEKYKALQELVDYRSLTEEWGKKGGWGHYHASNLAGNPNPETTVVVYLDLSSYLYEMGIKEVQFPTEIFRTLNFRPDMIQEAIYSLSGVMDSSPIIALHSVSWVGIIPTVPTFEDSMFWLDRLVFEY